MVRSKYFYTCTQSINGSDGVRQSAGVSPLYGARPLARIIQQELLVPLSTRLINESILEGEIARVTVDPKANRLVVLPNHQSSTNMDVDMDDLGVEELPDDDPMTPIELD